MTAERRRLTADQRRRQYPRSDAETFDYLWNGIVRSDAGCWLYKPHQGTDYPFSTNTSAGQAPVALHRWMVGWSGRRIRWDHHVHHTCQQKRCINPNHLLVVTPEKHRRLHSHPDAKAAEFVRLATRSAAGVLAELQKGQLAKVSA